jgi:hypothetical protein
MSGYLRSKALRGRLDDAIAQFAQAERESIYTALPGKIVSFDPATQRATVQPLYKAKFNGEATAMPELVEVPVVFPRGGGYAITFPVKAGDGVQLMFQSRNSDLWYQDGGEQEGFSARMHDLSDAVAIPGLEPGPRALEDVQDDRFEIRADDPGTRIEILEGPDRVRMVAGKCRLIVRKDEFVQMKVKPSADRDDSGLGDPHITLDAGSGDIIISSDPIIGPDPNPED